MMRGNLNGISRYLDRSGTRKPVLEVRPGNYTISASPLRLSMVMVNLIQNAQEASQAGGVVNLSISREGELVQIVVRDRGCGMDDVFLREGLFRPFATTKGNAGMGIGMYETRDYIESVGGMLEVVSEPGVGTQVVVTLPLTGEESGAVELGGGRAAHVASA